MIESLRSGLQVEADDVISGELDVDLSRAARADSVRVVLAWMTPGSPAKHLRSE